jgi:hypothetical protein
MSGGITPLAHTLIFFPLTRSTVSISKFLFDVSNRTPNHVIASRRPVRCSRLCISAFYKSSLEPCLFSYQAEVLEFGSYYQIVGVKTLSRQCNSPRASTSLSILIAPRSNPPPQRPGRQGRPARQIQGP